jgi:hypothetical protein
MTAHSRLVGLWTTDVATTTEVLVFKTDGTGFLEVQNPATVAAEWFTWSLESPCDLRLTGLERLCVNSTCTAVEHKESGLSAVVRFRIQRGVLRFAAAPWPDHPREFTFARRDIAGYEQPNFAWVAGERHRQKKAAPIMASSLSE